jgi:hypothetical protein
MAGWGEVAAAASPAASPRLQPVGTIARRAAATTVLMLIIRIRYYYTPSAGLFKLEVDGSALIQIGYKLVIFFFAHGHVVA